MCVKIYKRRALNYPNMFGGQKGDDEWVNTLTGACAHTHRQQTHTHTHSGTQRDTSAHTDTHTYIQTELYIVPAIDHIEGSFVTRLRRRSCCKLAVLCTARVATE